ncbi:sortase [Weissella minor]|uniref:sortase domain-containing protein n=1 Tax=Weissella minor TaxID=1620 RepID=UPI001BAED567|nr:sortase [Weissella minor]MBS0949208.1 sortase [Weissella minor]
MAFKHVDQSSSINEVPNRNRPLRVKILKKLLIGFTFLVALVVVAAAGTEIYSHHEKSVAADAAAQVQKDFGQKHLDQKSIANNKQADEKYAYGGDNDGIPDDEKLNEYLNSPGTLTTWGEAGTYAQDGLKNPITALPINEGVSNKVLASGWGTVDPGYKMGGNDNFLGAHNFADRVTYASPLQDINVTKEPTFYQTDGKKVYTYKLTKKQTINVVKHNDQYAKAVEPTGTKRIVLITCDEPTMIANLRPENRIIVSGELTNVQNLKDAPEKVQNIFPQFKKGA